MSIFSRLVPASPADTQAATAPDTRHSRAASVSRSVYAALTRSLEIALLSAVGLAATALLHDQPAARIIPHIVFSTGAAILAVAIFEMTGLYTLAAMQRLSQALPRLLAGWSLAMAAMLVALNAMGMAGTIDQLWLKAWFSAGAAVLVVGRIALSSLTLDLARQGRLTRRAVVYGSGAPCQELLKSLAADTTTDIRVCGIYDDRGADRNSGSANRSDGIYPNHGKLANLISFARASNIDLVILALPISAETRLMGLLKQLWILPADIRLATTASRLRFARRAYAHAGSIELIALADRPISDWGLIAKGIFDRVIGSVAIVCLAPVMALTALAIKLDSKGPVLFRQKRHGFNNELIEVFKFRSMYVDQADQSAHKLVTKDDPRVTRVGRFIRKTSLDELPQLFNVMIGNLSLVGPRPHAVSAKAGDKLYAEAFDGYYARHKVKPGITGWAQINGWRGETDTEDKLRHRVEHDLYYIENWSVAFDAMILLKTPLSLVRSENAY